MMSVCLVMPVHSEVEEKTKACLRGLFVHSAACVKGFTDVVIARQRAILKALESDASHLLLCDSDMWGFSNETIEKLLKADKDIISADYPNRHKEGWHSVHEYGPDDTLKKMAMGFCLIKREVFENVKEWFPRCYDDKGFILSEVASFSYAAKNAGYELHIAKDIILGHGEKEPGSKE